MTSETSEEYKAYLEKENWIFNLAWDEGRIFHPFYENDQARCVELPFPEKASEFAYLAVTLPLLREMDRAEWGGGTLVYADWGIWDRRASIAGYQMVERIRATFGEHRPFDVAPVNHFRSDEFPLLTNFILAALVYGWDAYYIPNYRGCFAFISHDEWGCIVTEREEDFKSVTEPLLADPNGGYQLVSKAGFCRPSRSV
ncbi:MAG TPA: hypothetical protein VIY53_00160 [Acidobacteriaceae bacterium]